MSSTQSTSIPAATGLKYTAYVCSHTHWDREWYGSFQQFRYRFVRLLDNLMDLLDRDPEYRCFNLDGQTIVLEDYLEIKPGQRARLEKFIRDGRIVIGPWYILPDEWLVSGESTIRNFLRGRAICREFGVEPPNVGYLPDMFGHISQIPQLLVGLGMDNTIFWRGLSGDEWKSELWWESPDGTRIFGYHIPEYCGYCNAAFFYHSLPKEARTLPENTGGGHMVSEDPEFAATSLRAICDRAIAKTQTDVLFLMNGVDHMEAQPQLPEILAKARQKYPDLSFKHATFEEFMDAVKAAAPKDMQVIKGEQRTTALAKDSGAIVLPNILSSRIHLKISNTTCQTLLERWVEPFATMSTLIGNAYPEGFIHHAWRMLLRNHPHDSIGGCSIDEVHYQMEARFREVEDLATVLTNGALYQLTNAIKTDDLAEDELPYFVFNPLNWEVTDLVTVTIDIDEDWLKKRGVEIHPDNIYRSIRNLRIHEWDGTPAVFHITNIEHVLVHRSWVPHFAPLAAVVRFTVQLAAKNLPPVGYKGYRIGRPKKEKRLAERDIASWPDTISNEHMTVRLNDDGTLMIAGKAVGKSEVTAGLHYFEDGGDNGDGYTYSPPRHDSVVSCASHVQISRLPEEGGIQALAADYTLSLPVALAHDRQRRDIVTSPLQIRSVFRIGPGSRRIDVETTLINTVKDHRLRVCFQCAPGEHPKSHDAEMQFDVVKRPNSAQQPPEDIWIEDEPLELAQQGFVSMGNLAIANFGIPEYEPVVDQRGSTLKLTLLRAVNYLGAGGHGNTMHGGAGPYIETPDQQLLGRTYTFRYSIIPHSGDWKADGVQQQAHQHNALFRGFISDRHAGFLAPEKLSFLQLDGRNIVLSAIKQVDGEPGAYIVRFWNSGDEQEDAQITWLKEPKTIHLANLAEVPQQELNIRNGRTTVTINPKQIASVLFRV
ncbi:MAG: alpha-mannosidase [Candidatus Sumerlaeaceae bacterium]